MNVRKNWMTVIKMPPVKILLEVTNANAKLDLLEMERNVLVSLRILINEWILI